MNKELLAKILTYGGVTPFMALAVYSWFSVALPVYPLSVTAVFMVYGAVIVSFIAGVHWGVYMLSNLQKPNLFIHSNIIALLAWASVFVPPPFGALLLIVCFVYLLWLDNMIYVHDVTERWFYSLRRRATGLVVLAITLFMVPQF